jgi:hypothetical protein
MLVDFLSSFGYWAVEMLLDGGLSLSRLSENQTSIFMRLLAQYDYPRVGN